MARYTVLLYPTRRAATSVSSRSRRRDVQSDTVEHALEMARGGRRAPGTRVSIEDGEPVLEEESPPIVASVDIAVPVPATA